MKSSIKIYDKAIGFVNEVYEGEIFILENRVQKNTYIFIAEGYSVVEKEIDLSKINKFNLVWGKSELTGVSLKVKCIS